MARLRADRRARRPAERWSGGNIPFHFKLRTGDVGRGFVEADVVVERTYTTQFVQHCHLEPHSVVARFDRGGGLSVWVSTAGPHTLRGMLAELLGLPLGRVRVHVPGVGGAFGSKMYLRGIVPPAVLLARAVPGRPVRLVFDRTEEFRSAGGRVPMRITMRTGARRDGTLTARQVTMWGEQGAYADVSPLILRSSGYSSPGPYRIPNASVDAYLVYTNRVPSGAFRALGVPQTCWAGEQQMDELAAELGMSPVELRRINLLRDGDTNVTGEVMRDVGAGTCLDAVAARVTPGPATSPPGPADDRRAGHRSRRGTGVALVWKSSLSPAVSFATVRLNHDGGIELNTAAVDNGQGAHTVLAQIAAETLSVPVESIHVAATDTQVNPFDRGSTASRTTYAMGNAVRRASVALLDRLREVAAGVLETAPSNLVFKDGTVAVAGGDPGVRPTYGEIITRHFHGPGELVGNGHYGSHRDHDPPDPATGRSTRPTPFWMYGAVAADVEVDTETGRLTVRRVVNVVDAGKAINPLTCEMQIHGATLQGLGMAVMEDLGFPGGIPSDTSFGRYRIPAFGDLPEIESVIVETPTGDGPFGARGIGEIGLAAVPAAIGNAVHAATGRRVADLPINARELARREEGAR